MTSNQLIFSIQFVFSWSSEIDTTKFTFLSDISQTDNVYALSVKKSYRFKSAIMIFEGLSKFQIKIPISFYVRVLIFIKKLCLPSFFN